MKLLILVFCFCITSLWSKSLAEKHLGSRIVGGTVAANGQFPWQVAIYYDTSEGRFFCGGALVSPQWVLTAAYCTYRSTSFTLHLGSNTLVDDDPNRIIVSASYSVAHPDYNPTTLAHDVALIRIDTPIPLNDRIQVVILLRGPLPDYVPVTISGWGAVGDFTGVNDELMYVEMKTIPNSECQAIYGVAAVGEGMICTSGSSIEGICRGDVGGPLIFRGNSPNTVSLVGIASWTSSTGCETNHPSGFTRTANYISWILSII